MISLGIDESSRVNPKPYPQGQEDYRLTHITENKHLLWSARVVLILKTGALGSSSKHIPTTTHLNGCLISFLCGCVQGSLPATKKELKKSTFGLCQTAL